MKHYNSTILINSNEKLQFTDITRKIKEIVKESEIKNGIASVYSTHTTSCIRVNENESRLIDDFRSFLEELAPSSSSYKHDDIELRDCPKDERINAHSHLKSLLLGASETLPISNNKIQLGKWQSIFHVDLDGGNRKRTIIVKIIGD